MKKNIKRLKKLIIIFGIASIVLFLIQKLPPLTNKVIRAFPKLKSESIERLIMTHGTKKSEIFKKDKLWFVRDKKFSELPADSERIDDIIDILSTLKKNEIISDNKSKYSQFEVDGKRKIEIYFDSSPSVIYIGKQYSPDKSYFRVDNDSKVYIAPNDLSMFFSDEDYLDLKPHIIDQEDQVTFIDLSWSENRLNLTKKKGKWFLKDGEQAKLDRVDYLINDIKTLKSSQIYDVRKLNLPLFEIDLGVEIIEKGKQKKGIFYRKDDKSSIFKIPGSNYAYEIPLVYVNSLKKTKDDITD